MWQFLQGALTAIPSAATNGYALSAYALAIIAYVISVLRVTRNKNLLANIQKLPAKDRLSALQIEIGGVHLAEGISPEQWVRSRIHRYYLFAFFATCGVLVAVVASAALKGISYAQTLTIINNEYRLSNGEPLSGSDLQHVMDLVKASMTQDMERAQTAFNQLSEKARTAYQRAYQSPKDNLVPPQELSTGRPATISTQVTTSSTAEHEPNNDILNANAIRMNVTVSGQISGAEDVDFFAFTAQENRRDYVDVTLNNDSTTLAPRITLYNPDKSQMGGGDSWSSTPGADLSVPFVAQPDIRYYIKVLPYTGTGNYRLTIRSRNAFDEFEPNDDILIASSIEVGKTIKANIMDPGDVDYYRFETGSNTKLGAFVENQSTTLAPRITVYGPDKGQLSGGDTWNGTSGADISLPFAVQPNSRYYVKVMPYSGFGKYALTVRPQ